MSENDNLMVQFEDYEIRRVWDEETEQWYFAVVDVIEVLTESSNPRRYWSDLKRKLRQEGAEQLYENIVQFDITTGEHKRLKKLKRENLRDHMTNAELVFTMLGELTTTEIARKEDTEGFQENKGVAQKGGKVAGDARRDFEQVTGKKVVSDRNYLEEPESKQLPSGNEEDGDVPF